MISDPVVRRCECGLISAELLPPGSVVNECCVTYAVHWWRIRRLKAYERRRFTYELVSPFWRRLAIDAGVPFRLIEDHLLVPEWVGAIISTTADNWLSEEQRVYVLRAAKTSKQLQESLTPYAGSLLLRWKIQTDRVPQLDQPIKAFTRDFLCWRALDNL